MKSSPILVLSRFSPCHVAGGAALRNLQNISGLARLGPVDVVTIGEESPEERPTPGFVRSWKHFVPAGRQRPAGPLGRLVGRVGRLTSGSHESVARYFDPQVVDWILARHAEAGYGLVVVEELSLAGYLAHLRRAGCRTVFDAHNVEGILRSQMARSRGDGDRLLARMKRDSQDRRLRNEERRAVGCSDLVWACSQLDAELIERDYGKPAAVVPNTLDVDGYDTARIDEAFAAADPGPLTMVFVGSFGYYPNEDAAGRLIDGILPRVRQSEQAARLHLVGRTPTPTMLAAGERDPGILVTGAVESVTPYLEQPAVMVIPLTLGSGTRLKALEAFAAGVPVVSTAKGIEGIKAVDGEHFLEAESDAAIAAAVLRLWGDRELREHLRRRARKLVEASYSWAAAAGAMRRSLESGVNGNQEH